MFLIDIKKSTAKGTIGLPTMFFFSGDFLHRSMNSCFADYKKEYGNLKMLETALVPPVIKKGDTKG